MLLRNMIIFLVNDIELILNDVCRKKNVLTTSPTDNLKNNICLKFIMHSKLVSLNLVETTFDEGSKNKYFGELSL